MKYDAETKSLTEMEYEYLFLMRDFLIQSQGHISAIQGTDSKIITELLEILKNEIKKRADEIINENYVES